MVNPYPDPQHPLPRPILWGAAALAVTAIVTIAGARATGVGLSRNPDMPAIVERELRFADQSDGSLAVNDAGGRGQVALIPPEEGGFVRATLRGLERNRVQHGISQDQPFRVAQRADGQLWLDDVATGQSVNLRAFGPSNAAAFAAFLPKEPD